MSFLDILKGGSENSFVDERSEDSIRRELIYTICNNKKISGDREDFNEGLEKMFLIAHTDSEINGALKTLSKKVLEVFPKIISRNESKQPSAEQTH